jgi:poly-gamma-glutamate capsule biosynthesis protein CapA/YwtB (metallophosphatase superfamily)
VVLLLVLAVAAGGFLFRDRISDLLSADASPDPPAPVTPSPDQASPAPPSPAPTEDPKGRLLIHGTGDVNVDPSYIPNLASEGWDYAWSGLNGLFTKDHLSVINLECAVSDLGEAVPKEFNFRGDPDSLPAMRQAGVEVANLGNNHAYDYGPDALVDTIRNLRRNDIAPVGAGRTQDEALEPALFELEGWTVAVVGLDQVVDPFPESIATDDKPGTAAGHDTGLMLKSIRRAERRADLVIVTIHWGMELDTQPRAEQVALGHDFIHAGADVIFGHHAHRLQPMDTYKGRPIFWGLGNFVWPNFSAEGSTTAVAQVRVTPGGDLEGKLLPAFIESAGHPVLQ